MVGLLVLDDAGDCCCAGGVYGIFADIVAEDDG